MEVTATHELHLAIGLFKKPLWLSLRVQDTLDCSTNMLVHFISFQYIIRLYPRRWT